jgi:hypothetical protein
MAFAIQRKRKYIAYSSWANFNQVSVSLPLSLIFTQNFLFIRNFRFISLILPSSLNYGHMLLPLLPGNK